MSRTSSDKGERVVRRTLADGTVKEYRYARQAAPQPGRYAPGSLAALEHAWEHSPEWRALAEQTRRTYRVYLRDLAPLGHLPVASLRRRMLVEMRNAIASTRGNGAGTGFMRAASALLGYGVQSDWIEHNAAAGVRALPGGHLTAWTDAEAARAMTPGVLPEPLRRVVVLAYYTGQRRGDLVLLPWSAYDGTSIRLRQTKTGAALVIPAHAELRRELDAWRRDTRATIILTAHYGQTWQAQHLSHMLPPALAKAGGFRPCLNVHGLRKLAATRLAQAGCSVHEIAAITGHRSLSMVQLYTASVDQERLATAAIHRLKTSKANTAKKAAK